MQKTVSRRAYIAIDLKSFYASVECIERGLDPLTTNLVADGENDLSGGIAAAEILWCAGASQVI